MKRFIAAAFVLLLLVSLTSTIASTPGSAADPLISLSYINNTFLPATRGDCTNQINNSLGVLYSNAEARIQSAYDAYILRLGGYTGYTFASDFTPLNLPAGTTAELVTGSTFILTSGKAKLSITSGTVINISTGSTVASGALLSLNQRYFCTEDTTAVFTASSSAAGHVDGYYKTTGSIIADLNRFLDVASTDWYYNAVIFSSNNGLFTGTSETAFSPQNSMTRGMFVTVLYRLANKPAVYSDSVFPDVGTRSLYYYDAVVWANANNIVNGYEDGKFLPDAQITREQMAVIIYRYASYAGSSMITDSSFNFNVFPDSGSISSYAFDAMKWAASNGIINGSDGKLLPKNTAVRAQVAQIVMNFGQKYMGM